MKKTNLFVCMLLGVFTFGQVGINNTSPKVTLDIAAKNSDGSTREGFLPPRLTGDVLFEAMGTGAYGTDQHGAVVFVTEAASEDNQVGQTTRVDAMGYYYFNEHFDQWWKIGSNNNIYNLDGHLPSARHVNMNTNNLGFVGGRIGIGTVSPDPSAILDLFSKNAGFLPPKMTEAQMNTVLNPAHGLVIYCTDCFGGGTLGCLMLNDSLDPLVPQWGSLCSSNVPTGHIIDLQCASASISGTVHSGVAASGITVTVPYTGGNGGTYPALEFNSTGVTGLKANLDSDHLANGNGSLVFNISGTPSGIGTASFSITVADASCTLDIPVVDFTASVTSLDCSSAVFSPTTITQGMAYTGTLAIPYIGGNGAPYPQQTFTQNGLTFTLPAGTLVAGNGNLVYNITGTATTSGAMVIPINFGGASCNANITVATGNSVMMCMSGNTNRAWATYNLGADTSLDPNIPVKEIHGNYYQWGRIAVAADTDTPSGAISGWNTTPAPNDSWNTGTEAAPIKNTANDPCPSGFRVPTITEWQSLGNNNTVSKVGTFTTGSFTSAIVFSCGANKLTLPMAGARMQLTGLLKNRGIQGFYWSNTIFGSFPGAAYNMYIIGNPNPPIILSNDNGERSDGYPIRCISE
ncbi:fibrobacter succinogenes major paralogous domain-containing protein [Chryseobacterium potabilaquae]|uniref:Uncharacterized protein n=1 Tax=Chryseobacterium potabilaquae TaxID=2675057 RepID=A0A6N4X6U5_9FLAO|nr:FISUMP domain-containing protein [Chryseobacterium potabilaquae]CAA7195893.1 hypothetical protein CHRY9293_02041 [Chryseobacterium potabilaquae]